MVGSGVSEVKEKYERIKGWVKGHGKFVVNERETIAGLHFSFLVWHNRPGKKGMPLIIGFPEALQKGHECIIVE